MGEAPRSYIVTDEPLRLAPKAFAQWDEDTRTTLLQHLRRPDLYLSGAPDAPPMPVVLELFAQHLELSRSWLPFTDMLAGEHARLDAKVRELLILRVAVRTRSGYEWRQHRRMGMDTGLTEAQVEGVWEGPSAEVWTPLERTLLTATDEFINQSVVSEPTWNELAAQFDPAELLEVLFLVGGYMCLAAVLNSVGLEPGLPDGPGPIPS
jgi:4-carboxymuconolactone decarboxylase